MKNRVAVGVIAVLFALVLTHVASPEVTNLKYDIGWIAYIPCSGDLVYLTGRMHVVMSYNEDGAGGIHGKVKFQPQNLQGQVIAGPNVGARYNGNGVTQDTFNGKKGTTYTFINRYLMIGQARAPNYRVRETVHVTVNANGEMTAAVTNVKVSCK